jgi:hypothetical protein
LILAQAIAGLGVSYGNLHRPARGILVQDVVSAPGQSSGEKGCEGWEWFSLRSRCACAFGRTPEHHDAYQVPRQPRMPQPAPGLSLGVCFCGVGRPTGRALCQGLRGAAPGSCFAGRPTALLQRCRGQCVARRAARKTPDHRGRLGKRADIILGRLAPIGPATALPPR